MGSQIFKLTRRKKWVRRCLASPLPVLCCGLKHQTCRQRERFSTHCCPCRSAEMHSHHIAWFCFVVAAFARVALSNKDMCQQGKLHCKKIDIPLWFTQCQSPQAVGDIKAFLLYLSHVASLEDLSLYVRSFVSKKKNKCWWWQISSRQLRMTQTQLRCSKREKIFLARL